jgi:hypothetical protein
LVLSKPHLRQALYVGGNFNKNQHQVSNIFSLLNNNDMSLINTIKMDMNDIQRSKLELIDNFDYSKVRKKVQEELGEKATDKLLDEGIENLKKYYVVALLDPLNCHAVSEMVDPFWHAHILFTRDYVKFCDSIYGRYIHHEPLDKNDSIEVDRVVYLYEYTMEIYAKLFTNNNSEWWPSVESQNFNAICFHAKDPHHDVNKLGLFPAIAKAA